MTSHSFIKGHIKVTMMLKATLAAVSFTLYISAGAAYFHKDTSSRIDERTIKFSLEENSAIGTELGTVAVEQSDGYSKSSLRYGFGSPSKLFTVDENTGRLITVTPIDSEMLCAIARQQEALIVPPLNTVNDVESRGNQLSAPVNEVADKITCSQNGRVYIHLYVNALLPDGSLRATHRVVVQVHDVNDNWPKFDHIRWHKRLSEVLYRKGRRLDLPKATDADLLEENNRVRYRLEMVAEKPDSPSVKPSVPFRLEVSPSGTPGLVLTEDLDAETKSRHQFVLVAYSPSTAWTPQSGESLKQMEARLHIDIEVADMNDNEPRFDSTSYNVSVAEDTPSGTVIYRMIAHDPDSTARLVYSMGSTTETAMLQTTFSIEENGDVRLRGFLDYELRHTYIVPIKVSDGEFTAQTQLLVHVLDVNDEPPEFEVNPKQLTVEENVSAGKLIGRVRIRDRDSDAVNGKVQCWEPSELRHLQVVSFIPDPSIAPFTSVYDLTTRTVLDRETVHEPNSGRLFVYLVCADGSGSVDGLPMTTRHTATLTATLIVKDDNDHSPQFLQTVYHAAIYENNQLGEKIIQVEAMDSDEGKNAVITYSILDSGNFKMDSNTGWITANVAFDRELRDSYQVTVVAVDQGSPSRSTSALLNVTILDKNDHQPQLLPHDWDSDGYDFNRLHTGRVGHGNMFAVSENLPVNTFIGDLLAKDKDVGPNAEIDFMMVNDVPAHYSERFRILRNGSLFTAAELDREEKEHYRFVVRVCDKSPEEPLTSTGTISIVVLDVNDNPPTFVRPTGLYPMNITDSRKLPGTGETYGVHNAPIKEAITGKGVHGVAKSSSASDGVTPSIRMSVHEKPGYLVTTLFASDPDAGQNRRVMYELYDMLNTSKDFNQGPRQHHLLRVNPDQGDVVLQRRMYLTDLGLKFFEVKASDGGHPFPKTDSKVLVIMIEDTPALGSQTPTMLASNYYSLNRSDTAFGLWGFEGRVNVFIIVALASLSGVLASVLITSIACVSGICSKNQRCRCVGRRHLRPSQRRGTSPRYLENGNGQVLNSQPPNSVEHQPPYAFPGSLVMETNGGYHGYQVAGGTSSSLLGGGDWLSQTVDPNACHCETPNRYALADSLMVDQKIGAEPQFLYENLPENDAIVQCDRLATANLSETAQGMTVVRIFPKGNGKMEHQSDSRVLALPRSRNMGSIAFECEDSSSSGSAFSYGSANDCCVTSPVQQTHQLIWHLVTESYPKDPVDTCASSNVGKGKGIPSALRPKKLTESSRHECTAQECGASGNTKVSVDQSHYSTGWLDIEPFTSISCSATEERTDSGRGGSEEDEHPCNQLPIPQYSHYHLKPITWNQIVEDSVPADHQEGLFEDSLKR